MSSNFNHTESKSLNNNCYKNNDSKSKKIIKKK